MKLKLRIGRNGLLEYAIVLNVSYSAYATLAYSILGDLFVLRAFFIVSLMAINLITIAKNFGRANTFGKLLLAAMILFGGTYLFFPENRWVLDDMFADVLKYVMVAFFISIASEDILNAGLKKAAYWILVCSAFPSYIHYITDQYNGYMTYGMRLLLAVILLEYYYFQERNKIHGIAMLAGSMLVLLYGNRSALLILVICLTLSYLVVGQNKNRWLRFLLVCVAAICGVIILASDLLTILAQYLEKVGISSRTLTLLLAGFEVVTDNNGRSLIWANCREAILHKPWIGYGIGGERNLYLLGKNYVSALGGVYAHNFVYELLLDFGVILGIFALCIMAWYISKVIRNKAGWSGRNLYLLLITATAIKLFFSSSIWTDLNTYVCLGLTLNYIKYSRFVRRKITVLKRGTM